jgi:hypothetical protein
MGAVVVEVDQAGLRSRVHLMKHGQPAQTADKTRLYALPSYLINYQPEGLLLQLFHAVQPA